MSSLIFNRPLAQGRFYRFQITATFFGETVESSVIEFKTPNAIRAIRKSAGLITLVVGKTEVKNVFGGTDTFAFDAYKKFTDDTGIKRLRVRVPKGAPGTGNRKNLSVGDRVIMNAPSGSPLSPINGGNFKISRKQPATEASDVLYIDFRINQTQFDSITPAVVNRNGNLNSTGPHFLGQSETAVKTKRYAVGLDDNLVNKLINRGNVRDVIVFSYRQYDKKPKVRDRLTYMVRPTFTENAVVDLSTPPSWEFATEQYFVRNQQVAQFGQTFDITEQANFDFYVTPVRYIQKEVYNEETEETTFVWEGFWLQANQEGLPRWGRADVPS